ncbi:MAG: aminotransferase class V-fold PLP-dependent enzyme [Candidatus Obscuribacterales bacterium]|nr:aminotransferase class V-fold PLP-dependent enzyme [Candidatus Obscuribacterales bacterium]
MRYFDNASTTYPKPEEVYRAQDAFLRSAANPGRGAHQFALNAERQIFDSRLAVSEFLGIRDARRLVFTGGCTQSLNMALKGLSWQPGDAVLTSALEHNAMMRPLEQLKNQGVDVVQLPYAKSNVISADDLRSALSSNKIRLCAISAASNVTGETVNLADVAQLCAQHRVPLLVDAAQSAGVIEQNIDDLGISIWCASGHKGLMGPPGVGLLYVKSSIEIEPLISGGTGSNSENFAMPSDYPDHLEAGTLPGPAILGLAAGVKFLADSGIAKIAEHELRLAAKFLDWAETQPHIHIYGPNIWTEIYYRQTGGSFFFYGRHDAR